MNLLNQPVLGNYGLGRQFPTPQEAMEAMMNMQKDYMKKTMWYSYKGVPDMSRWSEASQRNMARNLWSK